jgi:hypothetical protein
MGQCFQCKGLLVPLPALMQSSGTAAMSSPTVNCDYDCNTCDDCISDECSTTSAPSGPVLDLISPPRKSVCSSPKKLLELIIIHTGKLVELFNIQKSIHHHRFARVDVLHH